MSLLLDISSNEMAIYSALIGVGGTLLGVLIGYLLPILSKLKFRKIILQNMDQSCYCGINRGCPLYKTYSELQSYDNPEYTKIELDILITNPSDNVFNINNANLVIEQVGETYSGVLYNKNDVTSQFNGAVRIIHDIKTLTIIGKSSMYLELYARYNEIFELNKDCCKMYLQYTDLKGKTKRKNIIIGKQNETKI